MQEGRMEEIMLSAIQKFGLKARVSVFQEKGFTLIELMIALTILAIAMLGSENVLLTIVRNRITAHKVSIATDLCQTKIEELKSLGYNAVVNCLERNIDERGGSGGIFDRTVTVSTGPVAKTKMVLVRVMWNDLTGTRTVSLRTIVADI
jgi:prepilin-type N-terminal cleavage/methylation domain-containing protein